MELFSLKELLDAVDGWLDNASAINLQYETEFAGVTTDSRKVNEGDLFFALKGENFNGHDFINEVLNKGVKGVVVDSGFQSSKQGCFIHVADTTRALGDLAGYYRRKMPAKIIAITGSNGKTTTKDMIYHLLSKKFKTVKSRASFNNFIGVPLTIFELNKDHEFGVVEMGTNAFGEISRLSEIGAPDIVVITNVAETHLNGLKNVAGVQKAKAEILDHMNKSGTLLVNSDDEFALKIAKKFNGDLIDFGLNKNAKIAASKIKREPYGWSFVINDSRKVELPVSGYYNIFNCLAAISVAAVLGIEIDDPGNTFKDFQLAPMRMTKTTINIKDGSLSDYSDCHPKSDMDNPIITVINDAYNANPSSMRAAIREYGMMKRLGRKIFLCGYMAELGVESERLHTEIGKEIGQSSIDYLWAVGEMADHVANGAIEAGMNANNIMSFKDLQDLLKIALSALKAEDTLLIKGSRIMRLESVVDSVRSFFNRDQGAGGRGW